MARVLVIDDDPRVTSLAVSLRQQGIEAAFAGGAKQGLRRVRADHPDLVLVAWTLPDGEGAEVCHAIKEGAKTADIPVMLVGATRSEADAVLAFELGASDWLVKPISDRELALRIRAVLRRHDFVQAFGELIGKRHSFVGAALYVAVGAMLITVATAFRKIVTTSGNDVDHLMKAVDTFSGVLLMRIVLISLFAVVALAILGIGALAAVAKH